MMPFWCEKWGTTQVHGFAISQAVDRAREQVATFIGAEEPNEIIFTSGATESNNTVVQNALFSPLSPLL